MRRLALALLLAVPGPAMALSCLAPSVERSWARFDAADDIYVVVHGRLTLDEKQLPKGMTRDPEPPALTLVPAKLRGSSLTAAGFNLPFDQNLTLEVTCLGPWCGGARNGESVLAFVRKDSDGYALLASPCGGAIFERPRAEMLKQAKECLNGGTCTAE